MQRWDKSLPDLLKETMDKSLEKYEAARKDWSRATPAPPIEEREGLPLRVSVRPNPSGGGEIGAEMVAGRNCGFGL